ncbi:MAG: hypothetical protein B7O98_05835 [Zestosphaera tikiterensis]|uniref:Na+/H+ antiporter MnhB subunit-related protein domain-containing protein n=1 Tax=Zestosphaera tikiterensis TaxID=1973259 RepID=A0A2R7Y3V6_9CREN|nr:MAG: hypothetical protein B7O98_05835 [Zestosphaera tikiterensis]
MPDLRTFIIALSLITVSAVLGYALITYGLAPVANQDLVKLSRVYLGTVFNKSSVLWGASPEVVTSIIWDYRGLDTVYETTVFFVAVISALTLFRNVKITPSNTGRGVGMTVIVKTVSKIVFIAIPAVAVSITVHGHLTPGGGFQGGSTFSVASLLMISVFSLNLVVARGWSKEKLLSIRTLGLLSVGFVAFSTPLIASLLGLKGYLMQNLEKPWAPVGWPAEVSLASASSILVSGTLIVLNIAEFVAVSAGLSLIFITLSLPTNVLEEGGGVAR